MKKILVVGIILLFLGSSIPAIAQPKESIRPLSHILYVGGSGPGNYTVIQDAVDNASNGDTIFVFHGTYNQKLGNLECVWIYKSISLIGEDKNTTIIRGDREGDVIRELAGNVTISGFTLENGGAGNNPGAAIDIYKSNGMGTIGNISIHDNIIAYNGRGMNIFDCNNASCYNNIFLEDGGGCVVTRSVHCSIIYNQFLRNNPAGLSIWTEDYTNYINISDNEFKDCANGLTIDTSIGLTIHANNFINNTNQAYFKKDLAFLGLLRSAPLYKQHWSQNYWNDWKTTNPRPISGVLHILFGGIFGLEYTLPVPVREYDPDPVQQPYNYFLLKTPMKL